MKHSAGLLATAAMLAAAVPFWDVKPPTEWSIEEVRTMLTNSPWAQMVDAGANNPAPPVQVYIATAQPIQLAEDSVRAATKAKEDDPSWVEYRDYLVENSSKYVVIAIEVLKAEAFLDNAETTRMEKESELRIGKRKYKVTGHFPPSASDPHARLVFPRDVRPGDRSLAFDLYIPGAGSPYRRAEFPLKEMTYHGQPAF